MKPGPGRRKNNLLGRRFWTLLVIAEAAPSFAPGGQQYTRWRVRCDCGSEFDAKASNLGRTKTCMECFRVGLTERKQARAKLLAEKRAARPIALCNQIIQGKTVSEWLKVIHISRQAFDARMRRGWPIEKAATTPKESERGINCSSPVECAITVEILRLEKRLREMKARRRALQRRRLRARQLRRRNGPARRLRRWIH